MTVKCASCEASDVHVPKHKCFDCGAEYCHRCDCNFGHDPRQCPYCGRENTRQGG